ncbi:MAG: radical SAM protein [Anaerolineae bacterium]|nr:radical SAM protein [Anaerolineae bacterium]
MHPLQMGSKLLNGPLGDPLLSAANALLAVDAARKPLVRLLDRRLGAYQPQAPSPAMATVARQRTLIYRAVLHTIDRLLSRRTLSPHVTRTVTSLWARAMLPPLPKQQAVDAFRREHGCAPPWFLVLSPGHACNLRCPGCYASSGSDAIALPWSTLDRIMTEAETLWGVPLFVFSGGEPLLYRSQGRDLLDAVEAHADTLFLMFTNGTLIDGPTAERLARLGNLTPALSIEGWRARTDARRGSGTFDRVLEAMTLLREVGLPFGVSITVTRDNCAEVLSDAFLDYVVGEQGAFYVFLFQYTPIGRNPNWALVPTPEQRRDFWERSWDIVANKHVFLLDFGNHGPLVEGCIAAGRERGYLYIDWHGRVMPCVFMPYAGANIQDIYVQGGNLNDVWQAPFFRAIRAWQREQGYGQPELPPETNWLRPCPFRDHHTTFRAWAAQYTPEPEDAAAAAALANPSFCAQLIAQAERNASIDRAMWEEAYLRTH